ncbi:hypothetical protein [Sorangium sp. So ce233]|uniref:hypothetical protein n=1 Tax=Sorangium sp. So ce233 TaxID=3133290 RepID=UPI003F611F91
MLVERPLPFLRNSRAWVDKLMDGYQTLWNVVDARNEIHIRWLRWCGFTILRTIENYGVEARRFHEFARMRSG